MKLLEAIRSNSIFGHQIIQDNSSYFKAVFNIDKDGSSIVFSAETNKTDSMSRKIWEIYLTRKDKDFREHSDIPIDGKIFSTIENILIRFLEIKHPKVFQFSTKENSIEKLIPALIPEIESYGGYLFKQEVLPNKTKIYKFEKIK